MAIPQSFQEQGSNEELVSDTIFREDILEETSNICNE